MASLVFCGTSEFSVPVLMELAKHHDVLRVFSQPNKPIGRKKEVLDTPVRQLCDQLHIPCSQPEKIGDDPFWDNPPLFDFLITASYGQIIPEKILRTASKDALNIHASLLPRYRGASPIQCAILNGDTVTGVSIMRMEKKMDAGPILLQQELDILPDDTSMSLFEKLAELGSRLLLKTLEMYDTLVPEKQKSSRATYCHKITKDMGRIDFRKTADEIWNMWRAFQPWPGIFTFWKKRRLKLIALRRNDGETGRDNGVVYFYNNSVFVACEKGSLEILALQMEGKPVMEIREFLRGYGEFIGSRLG